MATTLAAVQEELREIRADITLLKHAVREEYPLTSTARRALTRARKTSKSAYVDL